MSDTYIKLLDALCQSIKEGKEIYIVNAVDSAREELKGVPVEYFVDGEGWIKTYHSAMESASKDGLLISDVISEVKGYTNGAKDGIFNPDLAAMSDENGEVTKETIEEFEQKEKEDSKKEKDSSKKEKKEEPEDEVPDLEDLEEEVNKDTGNGGKKDEKEKEDSKKEDMSTGAKIAIGIGIAAATAGLLWYGGKKLLENAPTATVVDID